MNRQAVNLINSFNSEFNQQLNENGDNENFSILSSLHKSARAYKHFLSVKK